MLTQKIPQLDFRNMTPKGYQFVENLFRALNWKNHRLSWNEKGEYFVSELDMQGTSNLWKTALEVVDDTVGTYAIAFLCTLHKKVWRLALQCSGIMTFSLSTTPH